ncbi:rhodanese-like domain-containing protein [Zunongwangia sp. F363]|uniref:Rhodanese-like domain-containing protein n=1 Tax=Autumnicola tepida TaxID=3075595 RepID=A0ABU3CC91_9FLAO|nr:rhodanese-like domain-containing protein [Zunongwangia sp. F363]MDT0643936.1 rhodanese-like domain-containing protein [Zunongwangia sp. F363]
MKGESGMHIFKSLFGKPGAADEKVKVLKKTDYIKHLKELNGILIDVRTPKEYIEDHIENARNINWYDPKFKEKIRRLDKTRPAFIYCRSGARSARAAKSFIKAGFSKVYDLKGGFLAFQN